MLDTRCTDDPMILTRLPEGKLRRGENSDVAKTHIRASDLLTALAVRQPCDALVGLLVNLTS